MAVCDSPTALAMSRVLQWVAALGFSSRVLVMISLDHRVGDRARGAGPRLVGQPLEPVGEEALPPLAHRHRIDAEPVRDVGVVQALGAGQDDPGAGGEPLRALGPGGPGLQLLSLVIAQDEWGFGSTAFVHRESPLGELYDELSDKSRFYGDFLTHHTRGLARGLGGAGSGHPELEVPLRIFRVGIEYLIQGDEKVLLDLVSVDAQDPSAGVGLDGTGEDGSGGEG